MQNESINKLTQGYRKFYNKYFVGSKSDAFNELVEYGQSPKTIIIACCDSRVDPAILFNVEPGSLFIVRNVANLVPPYVNDDGSSQVKYYATSAALEFAVNSLHVENIIVLGHANCGGISSVINNDEYHKKDKSFIKSWMTLAEKPCKEVLSHNEDASDSEKVKLCEMACIKNSYNNLLTFPWIKDKFEANKLNLFAWYFELETGILKQLNPKNGFWAKLI